MIFEVNISKIIKYFKISKIAQAQPSSFQKKFRSQKIPSKTFFPLIFRQSGHYIGVKKTRIGERSCRISKTKSQEAVSTFASIPYVPSINRLLKRAFLSYGVDYHSKPGPKLGNLLCGPNKTRHPPLTQKGVYQLTCSCNPERKYVGQTRVSFRTRMSQHQKDVSSSKSEQNISGISKHARECTSGDINWEEPEIVATFNDKKKTSLQQNLLIRESLEIRKQKTTRGLGLNDPQLCVRTNAWDPILNKLNE